MSAKLPFPDYQGWCSYRQCDEAEENAVLIRNHVIWCIRHVFILVYYPSFSQKIKQFSWRNHNHENIHPVSWEPQGETSKCNPWYSVKSIHASCSLLDTLG
jgi:hypothetical protein